jgi:endonuclease YncB( thermonuclease family)
MFIKFDLQKASALAARILPSMKPLANNEKREVCDHGRRLAQAFSFAILFVLLPTSFPFVYAGQTIAGRASVIDGDTIEIHGQHIRLWDIDAPEGRQRCFRDGKSWRCGTDVANALADFLVARTVTCSQRDRDRYRRVVATCAVSGKGVGAWLVRNGWALDYVRYSNGAYAAEEHEAEAEKRGLWMGEFELPWVWRRR